MNSVAIPRLPGESIGAICNLVNSSTGQSLTVNVEYNQLDPLLKETPAGGDKPDSTGFSPFPGNINVLVFKLPEYTECLERTGGIVPEFVNPKWADASKTTFKSPTRLECMMQDFPHLCGSEYKVGLTQLERDMCKTSVKNNLVDAAKKQPPECALSAEADIYACSAKLLRLAGAEIDQPVGVSYLGVSARMGARIVLQPSFGISLEEMKTRIKGAVRISHRSVLILDGPVSIDGLQLDGALKISGKGSVSNLTVKNSSMSLVEIPLAHLAKMPPSYQIRGYQQSVGELKEVVVVVGSCSKWLPCLAVCSL